MPYLSYATSLCSSTEGLSSFSQVCSIQLQRDSYCKEEEEEGEEGLAVLAMEVAIVVFVVVVLEVVVVAMVIALF